MILWHWKILAGLRVLSIFIPQNGYIHPDEFFQSPEVIAGDLFDLHTYQPWEFNKSFPLRCISFPYVTVGLPLIAFDRLLSTVEETIVENPYLLLIVPRLSLALLSLIHDWCIYNICKMFNQNNANCLLVFGTSYVPFVFYTRTFSNSIESILVSLLLLVVCKVIYHVSVSSNYNRFPFNSAMGFLIALGFYNRPTFMLYAATPVLFWLQVNTKFDIKGNFEIIFRLASLIPSFVLTCIVLTTLDSCYYLNISCLNIITNTSEYQIRLFKNLVLTPLNFLYYNFDSSNLAKHGIHPRFLHLLVNVPLLYGIIGLYGIYYCIQTLWHLALQKKTSLPPHSAMMLVSFILPILGLSIFSHQEPRFLLPLLLPLTLICSDWICGYSRKRKLLFVLWCISNLICGIFFGFLHQGGVVPSLISLNKRLMAYREEELNRYIIFYHTYMPPRHLLSLKSDISITVSDLSGDSECEFENTLKKILLDKNKKLIYVVVPNDIGSKLLDASTSLLQKNYTLLEQFFPHFSSENPPDILNVFSENQNHLTFLERIYNSLSLNLYQVDENFHV